MSSVKPNPVHSRAELGRNILSSEPLTQRGHSMVTVRHTFRWPIRSIFGLVLGLLPASVA